MLQASLSAATCTMFGGLLPRLALAKGAASAKHLLGTDYRALVCLYLVGGNDSFSTIVPDRVGDAARTQYEASRKGNGTGTGGGQQDNSDLRWPVSGLLPLTASGGGELTYNGSRYGLHPQMAGLAQLFNQQRAAIIANVGTLVRRRTRPTTTRSAIRSRRCCSTTRSSRRCSSRRAATRPAASAGAGCWPSCSARAASTPVRSICR
jgi:uncharacterized protein (DUF1501 family)